MRRRDSADAAIGFYFIGQKSERPLGHQEIVAYYGAQQAA